MKKYIVFLILSLSSILYAEVNSDKKWDCQNESIVALGSRGQLIVNEERGKLKGREVCIMEAYCTREGIAAWYPWEFQAKILSFCSPSPSGRCPRNVQDCVNDKTFNSKDFDQIIYHDPSKACVPSVESSSTPNTNTGTVR